MTTPLLYGLWDRREDHREGPLSWCGVEGRTYYNTSAWVEALETLLRKLPDPTTPAPPPIDRRKLSRARQLDADQVKELIAGYQAGATVYELGARFGVELVGSERGHRGVLGGLCAADADAGQREGRPSTTSTGPEIANRP